MGLTDANAEEAFLNDATCNLLELTWDEGNTPTPIRLCWVVCLFFTFLVFAVSEVSKNYSQTDKL